MARKRRYSYRKIYEAHYGPIGKDADGRSLEVHHINGNHDDNSIENLKLVTIQEHYAIHYSQGDWGACLLMSDRMKIPAEEVSRLSSVCQKKRIADGTHNLLGPTHNRTQIEAGTHHFLDKEFARKRNLKRVEAGTHNLLKRADGSSQSGDRVKAGKHHFVTNNPSKNPKEGWLLPAQIKLSCVACKKQSSLNKFKRDHSKCEEI